MNFQDLKNKTIFITGSSSGIGLGIAKGFLEEGAIVIINGRDDKKLIKCYDRLSNEFNNKLYKFLGDVCEEIVVDEFVEFLKKHKLTIDHLVCNVGNGKSLPVLSEDKKEFERMMNINLYGSVNVISKLIPQLEKDGEDNYFSTITLISSICSLERLGCPVAYSASKSALNAYMKNISYPLGRRGIRVNSVSLGNILFPGSTWDEKIRSKPNEVKRMLDNEVSLKKFGDVEDVANIVVFLASSCSKFISGSNIVVDGGQVRS